MIFYKKLVSEIRETKYIISIAVSLIIIALVISSVLIMNYGGQEINYRAENGVLDLKDWNVDEESIIKLDGQWEFYSGLLIKPGEAFREKDKECVNVPGSWESYLKGKGLENGSGTYRLIIKTPEDRPYGIKARTIRLSNRIYLNGREVASAGNPSINRDKVEYGSRYNIGIENSLNGEIEIIVHVTSHNYRTGGIVKSIEFGPDNIILKEENKNIAIDGLMISVCLVLALYFISIFFQRNKDLYLAYFAGTNFFMALNLSTMNEQILSLIYDYNIISRTRIQILAVTMMSICFLQFIHSFFREYSNKNINRVIVSTMIAIVVFTSLAPEEIGVPLIGTIQAVTTTSTFISYMYIFFILIKAIYKKAGSLEYILVIVTTMFIYRFIYTLKIFFELELGNIPVFLNILTMFSVAALTSHRLRLDFEKARDLSEELIRYDKLKDEFLLKISYELKVSLDAMQRSMQDLLEGNKGTVNRKQQEELISIYQKNQRLSYLANDLSDASLIKKGERKLRLASVNPYKITEDILKEIKSISLYNESILLKNQIPKDFPEVKVDADKFRQIIYNLVHNAIKYTEDGEIVISASMVKEEAKIEVKDTGIGIENKYLEKIFDIFYQKNNKINQGLGLGLSIVKDLVESQGGQIKAESTYGKGSIFSFTLPLFNISNKKEDIYKNTKDPVTNTMAELSTTMEEENNINRANILAIDEDDLGKEILSNIKIGLESRIIVVNSGREALDILETTKIDLLVTDFIITDMTCEELCKKIRKKYSMIELPILILTESEKTINLTDAIKHGIESRNNGGKIKISANKIEKNFIEIVIEDDGEGMTEEEQKELLDGNSKGIGFKNVMDRIKILKGASLKLKSKVGQGTKIKIIIPEVKKDESHFS